MGWIFLGLSILLWMRVRQLENENTRLKQLVSPPAHQFVGAPTITHNGTALPLRCPKCKRPPMGPRCLCGVPNPNGHTANN